MFGSHSWQSEADVSNYVSSANERQRHYGGIVSFRLL
jgi:hypothetical protein